MAYSYVKNEHDALDIIGEATYKGLKDLHTLRQSEYFDTWMTRIVINTAIDYIRKNTRFFYCEEETIGVMKVTERDLEPEELDQVIRNNMRRAEKENRTKKVYKWMAGAAAAFCILFLGANVNPVYAYVSRLPVIGVVVQVLHIGTGGERTDGAYTDSLARGETVDIYFEKYSEELNAVPSYAVTHFLAPNRMYLTLQGVRGIDFETIRDSLLATNAVKDVYRAMICDDSMWGLVIVMNRGYTYEITEYADPGYLSIRFYTDEDYQPDRKVYYLRSGSMPYGEELGLLNEMYAWEGATQLKTKSGTYILTLGQFSTESDAEKALEDLKEKYGKETEFTVTGGFIDDLPDE